MSGILDEVGAACERLTPRAPEENPFDPRCQLHLQRICGTCAHFQGDLRGGPRHGVCGYFQLAKDCRASAARCSRWERKAARDA